MLKEVQGNQSINPRQTSAHTRAEALIPQVHLETPRVTELVFVRRFQVKCNASLSQQKRSVLKVMKTKLSKRFLKIRNF